MRYSSYADDGKAIGGRTVLFNWGDMDRRHFLKTAVCSLAVSPLGRLSASGAGRPNVLMIIADDMNDYGFHGMFPGVKMPYLRA